MFRIFVSTLILFFVLVGCTRKVNNLSTIRIQTPNNRSIRSSIPGGQTACYGISVSATDIPSTTSNCSPPMGIVGGFTSDDTALQVTVPQGTNRTVDVYLYLEAVGDNSPCPTMDTTFSQAQLSQIYWLGSATNVTLNQPTQTVDVTIIFPGVAQNVAVQNSFPATCTETFMPNPGGFQISSSQETATGTGMKLIGRVGRVGDGPILSGGGIFLKVK